MISELDLVTAGLRFSLAYPEARTDDGHRTYRPTVRVQGPPDRPELVELVRTAVAERDMRDLGAARKRVWDAWVGAGGPLAVRNCVDKDGQAWSVGGLPDGVCETCSGEVVSVRDGVAVVGGGGMCKVCLLARFQVVVGR